MRPETQQQLETGGDGGASAPGRSAEQPPTQTAREISRERLQRVGIAKQRLSGQYQVFGVIARHPVAQAQLMMQWCTAKQP